MEHTAQIELANQADRVAVELGVLNPEDVRRLIVEDALVDTGATGLCLPTSLIKQLGLKPIRKARAQTATGIVDRFVYSDVHFTLLERAGQTGSHRLTRERTCPYRAHGIGNVRPVCGHTRRVNL